MLLLFLYNGFYISGLLLARWMTRPQQALRSGIATALAGVVACFTLWALTTIELIEPWLAIAMAGTIGLPALMMGLGLLAGWWVRRCEGSANAYLAAAAIPLFSILILLFG